MQDRYKFRVWVNNNYIFCDLTTYKTVEQEYFVGQEVVVEQSTKAKDRNNRLIYEGDIVSFNYDIEDLGLESAIGIVHYKDAEYVIKQIKAGKHKVYDDEELEYFRERYSEEDFVTIIGDNTATFNFYDWDGREFTWCKLEVIGNIHENNNLIK